MKRNIIFSLSLLIISLFLFSCENDPKKLTPAADPESEKEAVRQICEKREAECGKITVKIDDSYEKISCGECKTGFTCDDATNKCKSENDTDEPQDDTDDTEPQNDNDEPIPESSLPQCSSANQTPCKDAQSGLIWSDTALFIMNHEDAAQFCETLTEGGYSDWRLPNIDELRTLIMNCTNTLPNGGCLVSARTECLYDVCFSEQCGCSNDTNGKYSKFGDTEGFWSSSEYGKENDASWGVLFRNAGVRYAQNSSEFYLRCVRGENQTVYTNNDLPEPKPEPEPDPCDPNPCTAMEHSTGQCTRIQQPGDDQYSCECDSEHMWSGSDCSIVLIPYCSEYDVPVFPCIAEHDAGIWSSRTEEEVTWDEAVAYCEGLEESDFSDWELPDINKLRALAPGCDHIWVYKLDCRVKSSDGLCLSFNNCRTDECYCGECSSEECYSGNIENSNYSSLDQREALWSSSLNTDDNGATAWFLDFVSGDVNIDVKSGKRHARCVRESYY